MGSGVCPLAVAKAGRHKPVMPVPAGTSRSQTAICGRSLTALLEIVVMAAVKPGDVASTLISPDVFVDCTIAIHRPANAFREEPRSGSWLVGSPLPVPITSPGPVTLNVQTFSVIGRTRP